MVHETSSKYQKKTKEKDTKLYILKQSEETSWRILKQKTDVIKRGCLRSKYSAYLCKVTYRDR
jgi:hypothetical protein